MNKKFNAEKEINDFLQIWDVEQMTSFLKDTYDLFDLYNVDQDDDWVKKMVGEHDTQNVRLIRSAYLVSKIAEFHSAKLCSINARFKNLWKNLEEKAETYQKENE
jgi:hypothetical protein